LTFFATARLRAMFIFAVIFGATVPQLGTPTLAAGAFAIGKCGAYGQAFDFAAEGAARAAARNQCAGVDMANPCGAHGYAVMPHISSSLNEATRKCYEFGGKQCVIRAWACDARG
jgi:hypothetical protein